MERIHYRDYEKLIFQKAYSFSATTKVPFDELVSQSNLIFCIARRNYDPRRAKFSTWLYRLLDQGLHEFSKDYFSPMWHDWSVMIDSDGNVEHDMIDTRQMILERIQFEELCSKLSPCAREIIEILLTHPTKTLKLSGHEKARVVRGRIYRHLMKKGWAYQEVWPAFSELKMFLYNERRR
jgi:hypothetical protein